MGLFTSGKKKEMSLSEVTKLLSELRIPTGFVFTPINLDTEKKKFFNSDTYEPQFTYRIVKNKNAEIFSKLSSVSVIILNSLSLRKIQVTLCMLLVIMN